LSFSNGISIGSAVSAQLTRVPNTQTTLHATSVAIGRICALRAGDTKNVDFEVGYQIR